MFKLHLTYANLKPLYTNERGGGGGGIRYQVPDITLVGGSFFLPKTQLVHGTNWWVYCPFSRKTVSTWYYGVHFLGIQPEKKTFYLKFQFWEWVLRFFEFFFGFFVILKFVV